MSTMTQFTCSTLGFQGSCSGLGIYLHEFSAKNLELERCYIIGIVPLLAAQDREQVRRSAFKHFQNVTRTRAVTRPGP